SSACSMPKLKMKSLPFAMTRAKSSRYTSNLAEVRRAPGSSEILIAGHARRAKRLLHCDLSANCLDFYHNYVKTAIAPRKTRARDGRGDALPSRDADRAKPGGWDGGR